MDEAQVLPPPPIEPISRPSSTSTSASANVQQLPGIASLAASNATAEPPQHQRPPPIPQPQMYHGVSPAATSGGNNGNMVSLQSSLSFRLLPWPSCYPISIHRMAPALLRLQHQNCRANSGPIGVAIFQLLPLLSHITPITCLIVRNFCAKPRAVPRPILVLSGDRGAQKFFFSVPSSLSIMIIFIGRAP
ncbi:hypothetical protein HDV64DRAFT_226561 [Trichoderma sp. TUCIM 5745]